MILPGILSSQISGHLFTLTGSYDALSTVTVPSGGASSITFSAIPQTGYKHLQLRAFATDTGTGGGTFKMTYNGDTGSNYADHFIRANGATISAAADTSNTFMYIGSVNESSSSFGAFVIDILDYANTTKYKTSRSLGGNDANGSGFINMFSGLWQSTNGINSINITSNNGNFAQYSQFTLYGVK